MLSLKLATLISGAVANIQIGVSMFEDLTRFARSKRKGFLAGNDIAKGFDAREQYGDDEYKKAFAEVVKENSPMTPSSVAEDVAEVDVMLMDASLENVHAKTKAKLDAKKQEVDGSDFNPA
ncbi:hypothetical protein VAS14_07534 [Photobacterium angustum S14]|uniref:Uncharacterized protein n=2 Tax=Vibrionales TaxID=135623 RepID=Q1ZMN2_PHOAS|nr:hypothetical protein VAS14_07534 [Photobacterium angustum S14]